MAVESEAAFEQKVLALIAEAVPARFRKVPVTRETRLQRDLGLDSIAMLALLFRFEQAFGIDLATLDVGANLAQIRTVGDALANSGTLPSDPNAPKVNDRIGAVLFNIVVNNADPKTELEAAQAELAPLYP